VAVQASTSEHAELTIARGDWRRELPELRDDVVTLREVRGTDASSLLEHLNRPPVLRYVAPCPSTVERFRHFIRWARGERRHGRLACFGLVPRGHEHAVGVLQLWPIERDFSTAEWGFCVGEAYWGGGLFERAARLLLDAVFADLGVQRLEARAVVMNVRGSRVLEKLGHVREGVLRKGYRRGTIAHDYVMWSLLAEDWQAIRARAPHVS
jgi:ribosomal-protein-alanine N-acetyltransferase